jgi:hypothetical protein
MHAAINLALDFNTTTSDLEKIGMDDKWLRQGTEARRLVDLAHSFLPVQNEYSARGSQARRRQSPVGLRI